MTDFNYKKYSLENLENWMQDAISSDDVTPQEIYDTIVKVVRENHEYHAVQSSRMNELLSLLKGHRSVNFGDDCTSFWESSHQEYLKTKVDGYSLDGKGRSKYWYEYDRNDPTHENPFEDKVNRWVLPVQVDGLSGDCYINLPDDLLERAGLKKGDMVHWIDRGDGSFELRKVNGTK